MTPLASGRTDDTHCLPPIDAHVPVLLHYSAVQRKRDATQSVPFLISPQEISSQSPPFFINFSYFNSTSPRFKPPRITLSRVIHFTINFWYFYDLHRILHQWDLFQLFLLPVQQRRGRRLATIHFMYYVCRALSWPGFHLKSQHTTLDRTNKSYHGHNMPLSAKQSCREAVARQQRSRNMRLMKN